MSFRKVAAALSLLMGAVPAHAAWHEVRTPHFIVLSEGDPAKVRALAVRMESFDKGARLLLDREDSAEERANPVTVFVVDNVGEVAKLCREAGRAWSNCAEIAGFYQGRASGSVAFVPRNNGNASVFDLKSTPILFHEYTHHLMLSVAHVIYPAWYVEGFAEFMGSAEFDREGRLSIGVPPVGRLYGLVSGKPLSLVQLLSSSTGQLKSTQLDALYGRGWLLTHFLTQERSRSGQLEKYIRAINAGTPNLEAATAAFGDLKILDRDVDAYLRKGKVHYFKLPAADVAPEAAAITIRTLPPGEAAMMAVRLRSERSVNEETAPGVAAEGRRIAAAYPNDTGAQAALAEAELDAGNADAAEAAADRALAADPQHDRATLFKAQAIFLRSEDAKGDSDAGWRQGRKLLLAVNKRTPDAAWPLALFHRSFVRQGIKPTDNAIQALERAVELAPQDEGLRVTLAYHYLNKRSYAPARIILLPIAYNPHRSDDNFARKLVDMIDSGKISTVSDWHSMDDTEKSAPSKRPEPSSPSRLAP